MNDKFDELAKVMAQSVTRRAALKKFGLGMAAFALAALGLANNARAEKGGGGHSLPGLGERCDTRKGCQPGLICCVPAWAPPSGRSDTICVNNGFYCKRGV
jgi:hypothetical protein